MSKILIDGYNLIGVNHSSLKEARDRLIEMLVFYKNKKNHEITIVFDGYKTGTGYETVQYKAGIRIIYSAVGNKADDVLKSIIEKERYSWIVITSDKDIEKFAWKHNCVVVSSELFMSILEGEEVLFKKPRGTTLSKRDRALLRALSKL